MPYITLSEPKYPLTASEKKWLEERKNLCDRCPKRAYCRTGKKHNFNTQDCRFWEVYAPRKGSWTHEVRENFKDAAEFAARVAARLTGLKAEELPCYPNFLCPYSAKHIGSCKACYLKHARLAVEAEMEAESAGR